MSTKIHLISKPIKNKIVINQHKFTWTSIDIFILNVILRKNNSVPNVKSVTWCKWVGQYTTPADHPSLKYTEESYSNDTIGISRTTYVLLFWLNSIYKLVFVMINIGSDWREKETQVQNWHLETVGGYEHDSFPWAFFGIHRPSLLYYYTVICTHL